MGGLTVPVTPAGWAAHGVKRVRYPVAGLLPLPYETLAVPGELDQTIVVYTPEPGSETVERLALLGPR